MPSISFNYDTDDNTLENIVTGGTNLIQGQTNSIDFRFYFADESTTPATTLTETEMASKLCLINIQRPDNSASNNIVCTPVTNDGAFYYKFLISDWVTEIAGTLSITAKLQDTIAGTTATFSVATQNIQASASQSSSTITTTQYDALLAQIGTMGSGGRLQVRAAEAIGLNDLVMFSGTLGSSGKILVKKASQTGTGNIKDNPEYKLGIAITAAAINTEFYIQTVGILENIDTSSYTEGKILVPSETVAGGLIESDNAQAPSAPFNRTPIAIVVKSHATQGILYVKQVRFPKMSQVKDVSLNYSNMTQGQTLIWDVSEQRFKAGHGGGIFYDNNLPAEADRFVNLTYFDED